MKLQNLKSGILNSLRPVALIIVLVLQLACGPLDVLRGALKGAKPAIQQLADSGVISQAEAAGAITDFVAGGDVVVAWKDAMDSIPKDATNRKAEKARISHDAVDKWRVIVARGHFGVHPKVERAFQIADAAFIFAEAYYAAQAGQLIKASVPLKAESLRQMSEKDFEREMNKRSEEFKAALK